jgi:hypothetical protein
MKIKIIFYQFLQKQKALFGCLPMGVVVTILAVIFLVPVYIAIVCNGRSVSDDLYHMFIYTTCTAFWWKWIAEKTS